jgi:hypothetical protein
MRLKRQDMAVKGGALKAAEELLAMQRAARESAAASTAAPASADPPPARADLPPMRAPLPQAAPAVAAAGHANRVVEAWKAHRAAATASPLHPQHQ